MESLKQDYENGQKHMEEEARKEEEARAAAAPVITLDEILFVWDGFVITRNDHKESKEEEDDEKYHREFREALLRQVNEIKMIDL